MTTSEIVISVICLFFTLATIIFVDIKMNNRFEANEKLRLNRINQLAFSIACISSSMDTLSSVLSGINRTDNNK